ncbi:MAG: glycosyltransferase [Acidobacteria bacterium]|nr:glycosyltransferase [Acidobacteriota bacterium]
MAFPFLHPIFCRYTPILSPLLRQKGELWLNFSQTFALTTIRRNCVVVCHDLQCHCDHRFSRWVRWSERFLLKRAKRVVVLSSRDMGIVHRYYGVPIDRIENLAHLLLPGLHSFRRECLQGATSVAFLGSLARTENLEGLEWFVEKILPACPQLEVAVIGKIVPGLKIEHPQLKYLGFVEDLPAVMAKQSFMIAPLFSRAGIKIKVVESLLNDTPVLGTSSAFGGLSRPKGGWCSNRPEDWIRILNFGGTFEFSAPNFGPKQ